MRKFLVALFLVSFLLSGRAALADSNINKKSSDKKTASKDAADAEAQKQKTEQDRREELNNSEWEIYMYVKGTDPAKPEKDKLAFRNGTLSFKSFEDRGYPPSGYSLVVNPANEGGTWETNVAGKDGARMSIRGDWRKSVMNGVISEQLKDEKTATTYYFSSLVKKAIAPAENKAAQPAVPVSGVAKALVS